MKSIRKKFATLFVVLTGCAFFACHKDATTSPVTNTNENSNLPTSLQTFFQKYGAQTQNFTINATTGASIRGAKGTRFIIPPNGLVNSTNSLVTGTVNVQIKEIYSASDMVLSNMPTMAGTRGLLSEGEFFINFTQGNNTLHIDKGQVINAHMPLADTTLLGDSAVGVFSNNNNTWSSIPDSYGNYVSYLPDSVCVTTDSISWLNADKFYSGSSYFQVTVVPVNSPNILQTTVYMYVNGHHAIWSLYSGNNQFTTPGDIPQGAPLTIVGLALSSNGTVYSAFLPYINPGSNQAVNLSFSATTAAAFQTQLQALH